jgi:hypothetical protein
MSKEDRNTQAMPAIAWIEVGEGSVGDKKTKRQNKDS